MYQAQNQDDKTWGMLAHLLGLAGYVVGFGHFIGPLIVLLVKGNTSPYVAQEAKESLNFQITMLLVAVICFMLAITIIGLFIAIPLAIVAGVLHIVLCIVGGITAGNGNGYRYPVNIRFIR